MAAIQRNTITQSKRNAVSRLIHAKDDKERIAGWRSDLNRILHVFNVRSVVSVWVSLTLRFQTELAINTHVTVSETHVVVSNTHTAVSDTHTMVSDIHRTIVHGQERNDGKLSVSNIRIPAINLRPLINDRPIDTS